MRWSHSFIPTLRDDPADAEAASHKLLVRAGYVRQLTAGVYSTLPLAKRVCTKIEAIVRKEMDEIGGQEFALPSLHPADVWKRSGRWETLGEEMFRLQDRKGTDMALGMTAEEIFATIASELRSYRQLPQIWYQIATKFRDEPRPKSGLLRVREFTMKDSYSLDLDTEGLDVAFQKHFDAYRKIFASCGLDALAVEASSGSMGGSESIEFMTTSDAGEDWVASCGSCGYAANFEKATSTLPEIADEAGPGQPERFATPGQRSIDDLESFDGGAPAGRQIKTLVYVVDGNTTLVLLRGDHSLVEQKLQDGLQAQDLRPASDDEIRAALGASPGSLGGVGVSGLAIAADAALAGRKNMTTGANEDDFHLRGVDIARDIDVGRWLDLREVNEGEPCPMCDGALAVQKTIEIGHIFKLGTRYEMMGAAVLDDAGQKRPIVMGSYGIGIQRTMAAIVEQHHDEAGMVWPLSVAPYEVVITQVNAKSAETSDASGALYDALRGEGIDVLLDDRDERPGVKFKDAELIGIPYRITVGPKGLKEGKVELVRRKTRKSREIDLTKAAKAVAENVFEERNFSSQI
ncbi:MAG: proline--tRNA ligase [Deltaproteobacteria bacterium]|nr:proline--tRNA ligase [Deltaproteobacteria bacterium]MBW2359945.1 proline--tRNA ligase [Deltaproteobacteria bacterium]